MKEIILVIAISLILLYVFLLFWENNKKKKRYLKMQSDIKDGEKVLFSNGLIGEIRGLNPKFVIIKCGNAELQVDRASIQIILKKQ